MDVTWVFPQVFRIMGKFNKAQRSYGENLENLFLCFSQDIDHFCSHKVLPNETIKMGQDIQERTKWNVMVCLDHITRPKKKKKNSVFGHFSRSASAIIWIYMSHSFFRILLPFTVTPHFSQTVKNSYAFPMRQNAIPYKFWLYWLMYSLFPPWYWYFPH